MTKTVVKDYTNTFLIRGHEYSVTAPARFDAVTNQLVPDAELDDAAVEIANDQYRQEFQVVTPAEIKKYRTKIGLSQREFAELLGWSPNTVALYETGALPSKANNKLLKALISDAHFLAAFSIQDEAVLATAVTKKITAYLHQESTPSVATTYTAIQLTNWYRVRNYFDAELDPNVEELTQMKVVKLLYFAYGRYLALTGQRLFKSPIIAMPYGPVIQTVHQQYNGHRGIVSGQLNDVAFDDYNHVQADQEITDLLSSIQRDYGDQTAASLSRITHQPGSPWSLTSTNQVIEPALIQATFKKHVER